eukprot:4628971-Amphidinium_carterae.1
MAIALMTSDACVLRCSLQTCWSILVVARAMEAFIRGVVRAGGGEIRNHGDLSGVACQLLHVPPFEKAAWHQLIQQ